MIGKILDKLTINEIELHRFKRYRQKTIKTPDGFCLLAGSNNSGKSTFMQAFALWEFCKSVIQLEQGDDALIDENIGKKQGVGVNGEDFLPISIPSLKHLWTNLRVTREKDNKGSKEPDGYTLWIEVKWKNETINQDRHLRFSLSLANERLFIKTTKSNVTASESIPKIAYIPPFAGILNREPYHTKAVRAKLIGQGLSGSVMRNTLLELYQVNQKERERLKGDLERISKLDLSNLRKNDRWEHLLDVMRELFQVELIVHDFNEDYHSSIKAEYWKGRYNEKRTKFIKHPGFNRRDIMVEGSGLLQLLNVLSLSLDPSYQIVFLDEPDAHLHPTLQFALLKELNVLAEKYEKQILFATHSTELIASQSPDKILKFEASKVTLLSEEHQKIGLITGLGSEFSPQLHQLQRNKKVVFVENESDSNTLKMIARTLGTPISNNIVIWPWPGKHVERLQLFNQLKREISGLKGLSIRDRDNQDYNTITNTLIDKNNTGCDKDGLQARTWRYRYIETYLLCPISIASAANIPTGEVIRDARGFGIDLTPFCTQNIIPGLKDFTSKELLTEGENCLTKRYGINKYDVINRMKKENIHIDLVELIQQINSL
ncbi:AAA ATPase [Shewanella loihica PV-4]|uniref:AAA ATPase n=1 Tax=Shewanella loihica (strain ATCC BAA-1088 / PV-4) TaxID=323850 RepID=A3QF92_SHELP|nr:AAA ATPase [Shewanella loihica PV-4]